MCWRDLSLDRPLAGFAVATLAVALGACAVGPDYRAPVPRLNGFENVPVAHEPVAALSAKLDVWWLGFYDPVLTQIIRSALEQNLDLAASFARVTQARAAASAAGAKFAPSALCIGCNSADRRPLVTSRLTAARSPCKSYPLLVPTELADQGAR